MQQFTPRKTVIAQYRNIIHYIRFSLQNKVSKYLACCGRVHHSVSAETIGQKETGYSGNGTQDAMMIGRHLIEPGPGALGINGKILKGGHSISGMHENFLDERRFEVSLIPRRFFG